MARRGNPNWKKGGRSPNPGGRPKVLHEIRAVLEKREDEIVDELFRIAHDRKQSTYGRVFALRILAAYRWGNPISLTAVQLLDARKGRSDGSEVSIEIGFRGPTVSLDEFAQAEPEQLPDTKLVEDLRAGPVSERRARLERELAENEREIARLTRLQEERGTPLDLDELRRAQDRANAEHKAAANRVDPLSDWPGRTR